MGRYRPNVAAIFLNGNGEIFVAERSDVAEAWQFPQGGVDEGEDLETALKREVREEIGIEPCKYEIVESRGGYRYDFPEKHKKRQTFAGQEQTYFLCRFLGEDADFRLDDSPEFSRHRWIRPEKLKLEWLPNFKLEVYQAVMRDFFGVDL